MIHPVLGWDVSASTSKKPGPLLLYSVDVFQDFLTAHELSPEFKTNRSLRQTPWYEKWIERVRAHCEENRRLYAHGDWVQPLLLQPDGLSLRIDLY